MKDDLQDIDPAVVEKILTNADAFVEVDTRVDDIIAWGAQELKSHQEKIQAEGGTLEEFKKVSMEVEITVAKKLKEFEAEIQTRYPQSALTDSGNTPKGSVG